MSGEIKKKVRKTYSAEVINKALELIRNGASINSVSKAYNIPRSSLHSKVIQKYKSTKPGPATVFNEEEENALVQWILRMCSRGCPITKEHLINSIAIILKKSKKLHPFTDNRPGRHWYEGFLRRHPQLKTRMSESVTFSRALVSEKNIRQWFKDIANFLKEKKLENIDSRRVFNADETALLLNPKSGTVLAEKGTKNVYNIIGNNDKENVTVLVTANAAGELAPTMILFKLARVSPTIYSSLPTDFHIGRSEKGWMTAELFYEYIANKFYPWILKTKIQLPVVLFLDGHVSHLTQPLSQFCYKHEIILIIFPAHATHFLQPLDVSLFAPLKAHWRKHVNSYRIENEVLSVKKENFAPTLKTVFDGMNLPKILGNGFKTCGLHPFTPEALDYSKIFLKENRQQQSVEITSHDTSFVQTFEKYIPPTTLQKFKDNSTDFWTGSIEDNNLFYVWKRIINDSHFKNQIGHSSQIELNDTSTGLPSQQISFEPDFNAISGADRETCNKENVQPLGKTVENISKNVQPIEEIVENISNAEIIILKDEENEANFSTFQFYVDNDGNVCLPNDPLDLEHSFNTEDNSTIIAQKENEISTANVSSESKSNIEDKRSVLLNIQNLNQSDPKIPEQFNKFLFWPNEKKTTKKRTPKIKLPSVLSSEEGLQWYAAQEEKKRKIEEEKKLKQQIKIAKGLIKKENKQTKKKTKN